MAMSRVPTPSTSATPAAPVRRPTWDDLVTLEPRLAGVAEEARRRRAIRRGGHPAWYGYGPYWDGDGLKTRLARLVGWSRREDEWDVPYSGPRHGPLGAVDIAEYAEWWSQHPDARRMQAQQATAQAEDETAGRRVLWTTTAYHVAYHHVLHLCFHCRHRCSNNRTANVPRERGHVVAELPHLPRAALSYARAGMRVFFVTTDKHPLKGSHGYKDATSDRNDLVALFEQACSETRGLATAWVPGPDHLMVDLNEKKGRSGRRCCHVLAVLLYRSGGRAEVKAS